MNLPTISIIIPTLNSEKTIALCLEQIKQQDYSRDKLEIIIADGGSEDSTLTIVKEKLAGFNYKVILNKLKTGEAGKAVGVKSASNEIVGLIDSDNLLPEEDWLKCMVLPFEDSEIVASEPLSYTYRKDDGLITRYCALIGMNDPLCLFLGNYDRYCVLTGEWTEVPYHAEDKKDFLKIKFNKKQQLPTIGANGFFIRRDILNKYDIGDYLFDIDIICDLVSRGSCAIAKVKVGIIHLFSGSLRQFVNKQRRRIKDYTYYKQAGLRKYQWEKLNFWGLVKFCSYSILVIPLLCQILRGYFKKQDRAWFFHLPACCASFYIYSCNMLLTFIKGTKAADRNTWQR